MFNNKKLNSAYGGAIAHKIFGEFTNTTTDAFIASTVFTAKNFETSAPVIVAENNLDTVISFYRENFSSIKLTLLPSSDDEALTALSGNLNIQANNQNISSKLSYKKKSEISDEIVDRIINQLN